MTDGAALLLILGAAVVVVATVLRAVAARDPGSPLYLAAGYLYLAASALWFAALVAIVAGGPS